MAVLRRWILAAAVVFAAPLHAQAADSPEIELGRHYTQWLYEGQVDSLWAKFSPEMRQAIPTPQALSDMRAPIFAVATMTDHVSPWRSVHKIHLLSQCEVQFVLTSGGHNAGIVSEPGHKGRHYYTALHPRGGCYTDPGRWVETAEERNGSWWQEWLQWLERVSPGPQVAARQVGPGLCAAPGTYVLER